MLIRFGGYFCWCIALDIATLGSIGELIGGVAVIVTLVYLALQLRNYQQSMASSVFQTSIHEFNHLNVMLAADPEMVEILERGLSDPGSLDDRDERRFVWMTRAYANAYLSLYYQYLAGACPEDYWLTLAAEYKQTLKSPGGKAFRKQNSTFENLFSYLDSLPDADEIRYSFHVKDAQ